MSPEAQAAPLVELLGAPWAFVLAAALASIGALLLPRRVRARALTVPALEPWLAAVARTRPRARRLRPPPWLLLQVAVVALLGAAALDPRPHPARSGGRHLVIALEASAAMALPAHPELAPLAGRDGSRLAAARALARAHLDALAARDRAALIVFSDAGARVPSGFADGPQAARAGLDAVRADGGPARTADALALAAELARGRARPELLLLRAGDLGPGDNLALVAFGARRAPPGPLHDEAPEQAASDAVQLVATVENLGPRAVPARLLVHAGRPGTGAPGPGQEVARAELALPAHGRREVVLEARVPRTAVALNARLLAAPGDDLVPDDGAAGLVLPARRATRVLVIGERDLYLDGALLSFGDALAVTHAPAAEAATALARGDSDLVIAAAPLPVPIEPGPGHLLLGGHPVPGDFPYRVAGELRAPVITEQRAHPLLAGVSLRALNLTRARLLQPAPGVEVLASGFGVPLVLAAPQVLALAFEPRRSDLPLRPAWPLLLGNVIERLARRPPGSGVAATPPPPFVLDATPSARDGARLVLRERAPPPPTRAPPPWRLLALVAALALAGIAAHALWRVRAVPPPRAVPAVRCVCALAATGAALVAARDPHVGAPTAAPTRFVLAHPGDSATDAALADALARELRARAPGSRVVPARVARETEAPPRLLARALAEAAGAPAAHLVLVARDAQALAELAALGAAPAGGPAPGLTVSWLRPSPAPDPGPRGRLGAPEAPRVGEPFALEVEREPTSPGADAPLELVCDGRPLRPDDPDAARALRALLSGEAARARVPVRLDTAAPAVFELRAGARVLDRLIVAPEPAPRVLVVAQHAAEARSFAAALGAQGLDVQQRAPDAQLAEVLADGAATGPDLLVLANLPAAALPAPIRAALGRWVDAGGGLLVAGGPASFAAGGYADSALAPLLPVTVHDRVQHERDTLALALVLDRSGSMSGAKLELLRLAARGAALALRPDDAIAVVAFDSRPETLVRLQPAGNRPRILAQLERLTAGGGTAILPAVREGIQQLLGASTSSRHLIVVSDGQSSGSGLRALVQDAEQAGITLSAIGIGPGADRSLLQELAEQGGGRFHHVEDETSLPRVFARELAELRPAAPPPRALRARPAGTSAALEGIAWSSAPALSDHNPGRARPGARVLVRLDDGAPLFVTWQRGLGRVATWHTDLGARWAAGWARWPQAARLWAQLARATMRAGDARRAELRLAAPRLTPGGLALPVTVDLEDAEGGASGLHGSLDPRAVNAGRDGDAPAGRHAGLPFVERRPGLYEVELPLPGAGDWRLAGELREGERARFVARGFLARAEAVALAPAADELARALARRGGLVLTVPDGDLDGARASLRARLRELRDEELRVVPAATPSRWRLAPWLLLLALGFFVATVRLGRAI